MQVGQQVRGEYMGQVFSGVIASQRMLTVKTDGAFERFVTLDKPVTVFGTERDTLVVYTQFDGSPSSYTKHTDRLVSA